MTLDSDSVLDPAAIREGLKPFADPESGLSGGDGAHLQLGLGHPHGPNGAVDDHLPGPSSGLQWSQLGCVLVNSGGLAFPRAAVVRAVLPAYLSETFFGHSSQVQR